MKKMTKNIILILLLILLINSFLINNIFAEGDYIDIMDSIVKREYSDKTSASEKVNNLLTTIIVAVKIIAVTIAIIMLLVLAMKYMISSPGEKADIKKHAIVYVVGALILFATAGILSLIQKFSSAITSKD